MKDNDNILIDKMIRALEKASLESGKILDPFAWWPINYLMYDSLFINDVYKSLFKDYEVLRKSHSLNEMSKVFSSPTATWLFLVSALRAMKSIGMSRKKRVKITLELLSMLEIQMSGNIFCEDKKNIVWDNERAQNFVYKTKWKKVGFKDDYNKLFKRLHAILLSLDEAIFWNANCATREIHGPYNVIFKSKPAQLLVRDYYNLKAPELESKLHDFPYKSFVTYTLYDNIIQFDFPVLNDFTHDLPLTGHTLAVFGEANKNGKDRVLNRKKALQEVCEDLEKKCFEISIKVESMTKNEQVLESIRRVYYRGKVLRDVLKKDWKAPGKLLKRVERDLKSFPEPKYRKITKMQFYRVVDPRID